MPHCSLAEQVMLIGTLLFLLCSAQESSQLHTVTFYDSRRMQHQTLAPETPHLQLFTMLGWATEVCEHCNVMWNATQTAHNVLVEAFEKSGDESAKIVTTMYDCSAFSPGEGSPCQGVTSFPSLQFVLGEENSISFRGFADAFAVFSFVQKKVPQSWVPRDFLQQGVPASLRMHESEAKRVKMVSVQPSVGLITMKGVAALRKEAKVLVIAIYPTNCDGCTDALLKAEHLSVECRSPSVVIKRMAFDANVESKWAGRQSGGSKVPNFAIFIGLSLNGGEEQGDVPLLVEGDVSVSDVAKMLVHFTGEDVCNRSLVSQSPKKPSFISKQLRGLTQSPPYNVLINSIMNDQRTLYSLRKARSPIEDVPGVDQLFLVLVLAKWTSSSNEVQTALNHFVSAADSFRTTPLKGLTPLNVTFSVFDGSELPLNMEEVKRELFSDGAAISTVCPLPPCVLTCLQSAASRERCGFHGKPFAAFPYAINSVNLRAFILSSAEDKSVVEFEHSTVVKSLEMSRFVAVLESLKPWVSAEGEPDDDDEEEEEDGSAKPSKTRGEQLQWERTTLSWEYLDERKDVLLLLFNHGPYTPSNVAMSRRHADAFSRICEQLNASTEARASSLLCATMDAARMIAYHKKFAPDPKTTEPFIVHLSRKEEGGFSLQSVSEQFISGSVRSNVVKLKSSFDLILNERRALEELGKVVGVVLPPESLLVTLTSSTFERTIHDPVFGVLVLFTGGPGCPHSRFVTPVFEHLASRFSKERHELIIAQIDGRNELTERAKKEYNLEYFPQIRWFPRESYDKGAGELYQGPAHKDALMEFVTEEMGYNYVELEMTNNQSVTTVTSRNFIDLFVHKRNQSHSVVLLYNNIVRDDPKIQALRNVEVKFRGNPNFATEVVDKDTGEILKAEPANKDYFVEFYKMDGRRFTKLLNKHLLTATSKDQASAATPPVALPTLLFLPRGEYKLVKYRTMKTPKFTEISMAQFALENIDKKAFPNAMKVFDFSEEEIAQNSEKQALRNVKELDTTSFYEFLEPRGDAVVLFYASWCDYSSKFMPVFAAAAAMFDGDETIRFAKVDVPANAEVGHGQGIQMFPTVKVFFEGSVGKTENIGEEFPQDTTQSTAGDLVKWITSVRGTTKVQEFDRIREEQDKMILDLNSTGFEAVVLNSSHHVFIEFYADWCGHCRQVIPTLLDVQEFYRQQAKRHPRQPRLIVAKMNGVTYGNMTSKYNATEKFPHIMLFVARRTLLGELKKDPIVYNQQRFTDLMIEFIEKNLPQPTEDEDFAWDDEEEQSEGADRKAVKETEDEAPPATKPRPTPTNSDDDEKNKAPVRFSDLIVTFTDNTITQVVDTTKVILILHHTASLDSSIVRVWNDLAKVLKRVIERGTLVVGTVQWGYAPAASRLLGPPPSVTIFRGFAQPRLVQFQIIPEDSNEGRETRAIRAERILGDGGYLTNLSHVFNFVEKHYLSAAVVSIEITDRYFDETVNNASLTVVVMFYAPWSQKCKDTAAEYDAAAQSLAHESHIVFCHVDISKNPLLYQRFGSRPVPAIFVFDRAANQTQQQEGEDAVDDADGNKRRRKTTPKRPRYFAPEEFASRESLVDFVSFVSLPAEDEFIQVTDEYDDYEEKTNKKQKQQSQLLRPLRVDSISTLKEMLNEYSHGAFIIFKSSWCSPASCGKFDNVMAKVTPVLKSKMVVIEFVVSNAEEALLRQEFGIVSFPTFAFRKESNTQQAIMRGKKDAVHFIDFALSFINSTDMDSNLPDNYEPYTEQKEEERVTIGKEGDEIEKKAEGEQEQGKMILSLTEEEMEVAALNRRGKPLVIFAEAEVCASKKKCNDMKLTAIRAALLLHGKADVRSVALADKKLKQIAKKAPLRIISGPSFVVWCRGTPWKWIPTRASGSSGKDLLEFVEKKCFETTVLEKIRALAEVEIPVEEVPASRVMREWKSYKSLFVMFTRKEKCSSCVKHEALWRQMAGALQANPQIQFVKVDAALDSQHEIVMQNAPLGLGLPKFVLFPLGGEPRPYFGPKTIDGLRHFLEQEEGKVREL